MLSKMRWILVVLVVLLGWHAGAETTGSLPIWERPPVSWFSPGVHLNVAAGDSSTDPANLAVGHHDPTRKQGTVQGLELGMSMRAGEHVEGFATYTLYYGAQEEWEREWEEAFLKLARLPGGFDLRGGRMLAHFGRFNPLHLHAWDTVDMPLVIGRFLGDDGLILDGGDATWSTRYYEWTLIAIGGYGKAKSHDHDEAHEDEHGDDHADAEDHHDAEDEHEHHHHDEGVLNDKAGMGRVEARYAMDDFHRIDFGLSLAVGDNGYERTTAIYGADLTFSWRENGLEPGGQALRWTTEVLYRNVEASLEEEHHDHAHEGETGHHDEHMFSLTRGEWGAYTEAMYSFNAHVDGGLRLDYVEGIPDLGTVRRQRVSPVVAFFLDEKRHAALRFQYNYDRLDGESENSFWVQLGLSWGGPEVR